MYDYNIFLDNNPQIKKNLKEKPKFAITPDIYYNVFVPIFIYYAHSVIGMLATASGNWADPDKTTYLPNFCKEFIFPIQTTKYAN